jgi:hypothetical protein
VSSNLAGSANLSVISVNYKALFLQTHHHTGQRKAPPSLTGASRADHGMGRLATATRPSYCRHADVSAALRKCATEAAGSRNLKRRGRHLLRGASQPDRKLGRCICVRAPLQHASGITQLAGRAERRVPEKGERLISGQIGLGRGNVYRACMPLAQTSSGSAPRERRRFSAPVGQRAQGDWSAAAGDTERPGAGSDAVCRQWPPARRAAQDRARLGPHPL